VRIAWGGRAFHRVGRRELAGSRTAIGVVLIAASGTHCVRFLLSARCDRCRRSAFALYALRHALCHAILISSCSRLLGLGSRTDCPAMDWLIRSYSWQQGCDGSAAPDATSRPPAQQVIGQTVRPRLWKPLWLSPASLPQRRLFSLQRRRCLRSTLITYRSPAWTYSQGAIVPLFRGRRVCAELERPKRCDRIPVSSFLTFWPCARPGHAERKLAHAGHGRATRRSPAALRVWQEAFRPILSLRRAYVAVCRTAPLRLAVLRDRSLELYESRYPLS